MKIFILFFVACFLHSGSNAQQKGLAYFNLCPTTDFKQAIFPGGENGWVKYLEHTLTYPEKAMENGIDGTIRVQITVLSDGKVTNVKALNNPGGGLAEEAMRVLKKGPKWIPAEQNGQKITSTLVQNIVFKIM